MMPPRPRDQALFWSVALSLSTALLLAACASDPTQGYSFSSTYNKDVRTVHVPMFKNDTYFRDSEVELTDAVVKEIQRTTPWRVAGSDNANTTLTGRIVSAQLRTLSIGRDTGLVQEQGFQLTVEFVWRDNRTGKVLVERKAFTASDSFIPAQQYEEHLGKGQFGAYQTLARDIVNEMRSNW